MWAALCQWIAIITGQLLAFIIWKVWDLISLIRFKEWKIFKGFGLHLYCGLFGSGKTSSMVHDAYVIAKRFPQVTILTNMQLKNFPNWTKIMPLENFQQIIDAPPNTVILIDEISTVFNSRDWKTEGIPAALLGMLLQVRKERKMILGTAQRFQHVDSLIRQITFSVRDCMCIAGRWNIVKVFNALDYENTIGNTVKTGKIKKVYGFIQTDFHRELYDTMEMVQKMKKDKYIADEEAIKTRLKVI
jgi:hypothetical protein